MPETKRSIHPLPVSRPAVLAVALGGALCAGAQTPDPALEQGLQLLEEARTTLDDKALAAGPIANRPPACRAPDSPVTMLCHCSR